MTIEHFQSHFTHIGMYWQKMAEQVVVIQNATEESDCDSDCDQLVIDPEVVRLLRLESDSCE